eukprot:g4370.t1
MQLIDIEKLDVSWDAASLALNGILDTGTETSDLTLQLANFNINRLNEFGVPIPDDAEIIIESATGQLSGDIRDPDARLNAELTGDYADLPLQAVIDASGNASAVEIESLVVSLADAALGAKGMIDLQTDNSQFVFQLTNFDLTQLEQFGVALPSGILARVESANGEFSGNLRDPDAQLNAQLAGNYADLPFELSASAIKTQSMLVTDKVDMRFGDNQLLASGAIDLDTMIGEFNVETEPFSIKIFELTGISLPTELAGMLEGNANISGDLRNPQVFANLNLDGRYKDISYRAKADLSRVDQLINIRSINISALERDVLDIQGSVDHENLDIQLVANRLPAELLSAVGLNIAPGAFTADFNVAGPIRLPDMNGFLSYKTTPAESGPNGVLAENQFEWRLEAETLGQDSDNKPEATGRESYRFRSIFSTSGTPSGELSFQIPARPYMDFIHRAGETDISTLPLNVRLDGGFDLSMVALFADPDIHRLSGRLVADLDIRGTLASPSFLGEVAFQDTDYENPLSGTHIEQLNCVLNADDGRFEFGKCVASDGDSGNFTIRGSLALPLRESSGDIDIEMEVNRARVIQRPEIESQATGSIQLTGDFQSLLAKGSIEVAPLEASIESGTSSGIPKIQVEKVESLATYNGSEGTSNAASPLITLDLLITATQQAYIRGRGLEAELQGEIYLKGTAQKPRYEGEFSTIRGDFEVFGKTFELENGLVNFANDAIGLNFEGVYEEDGQSVTALITGTAEDLNISFTATPAMAEDEILAFIIFGKSIQEITPFEAIQLASAVQQLRGGGGFDPIGAARDALGVDRLSIESETLEDNSTGVNNRIWLHSQDQTIEYAAIRHENGLTYPATAVQSLADEGLMSLNPDQAIPAGNAKINIAYSAPYNLQLVGLYKAIQNGQPYLASQMEAIDARRFVPSFDEPRFKTPWSTRVRVPADQQVITNGPLISTQAMDDGWVEHQFATTRSIPSYLLALAVGPYDALDSGALPSNEIRSTSLDFRGFAASGKAPKLKEVMDITGEMLRWQEQYFDYPYPYAKLDLIAAPDFAFGAMENAGAIIYRESRLLLDENTSLIDRRRSLITHAHELGHQWFGNLVTPVWWDDIWLNEAFATWISYKTMDAVYPETGYDLEPQIGAITVMDTDSLLHARQIRNPVLRNEEIIDAFDGITYRKGGGVLAMFEAYLGEQSFREGMRLHMQRYQDDVADVNDFMRYSSLTDGEQLSFADSLTAAYRAGTLAESTLLEALAKISQGFWAGASDALAEIPGYFSAIEDEDGRDHFRQFMSHTFGTRYQHLESTSENQLSQGERLLKTYLKQALLEYAEWDLEREQLAEAAMAFVGTNGIPEPNALDSDSIEAGIAAAAALGNEVFYSTAVDFALNNSNQGERRLILNTLAKYLPEPQLLDLMSAVQGGNFQGQETWSVSVAALENANAQLAAWDQFKTDFRQIVARAPEHRKRAMAETVANFCDSALIDEAVSFFQQNAALIPGYERRLAQGQETARLCAAFRTTKSQSLATAFKQY